MHQADDVLLVLKKRAIEKYGTVTEFANEVGMSRQLVSHILNGHRKLYLERFMKFAEVLELEVTFTAIDRF